MRRLLPLALVLAATSARADGFYYSESFGGVRVKDELAPYLQDVMRIRAAIGMRHSNWALEAFFAGNLDNRVPDGDAGEIEALDTYGLDLKYLQPVSSHLEVYLRGSVSGAVMDGALNGYSGRGLGMGAGIQLKGKVRALGFLWWPLFFTGIGPKVTGAVFLDTGYDFYRLHGPAPTAIDAQLSHMSLGFAVGSDF